MRKALTPCGEISNPSFSDFRRIIRQLLKMSLPIFGLGPHLADPKCFCFRKKADQRIDIKKISAFQRRSEASGLSEKASPRLRRRIKIKNFRR